MPRLRSFYEGDRAKKYAAPTAYLTADNQNEVYCGFCGESFYIDDLTFEKFYRRIEETHDNPFVCSDCRNGLDLRAELF